MNSGRYRWFTKEEVASWPVAHKKCRGCQEVLPLSVFHKQKTTLLGVANYCKTCRIATSKKSYQGLSLEELMVQRARSRANRKGLPCTIGVDDIVIPEYCPALGVRIIKGDFDYGPSLDRIRPELGYVPWNVVVISNKANRIKSNASALEVKSVAEWMLTN